MKFRPLPVLIPITLSVLCGAGSPAAWGQNLPPVNMGKFVGQPGDNQYSGAGQAARHAPAPTVANNARPMGYMGTPAPKRPDISLEPIAAAEPIPGPGFPPMPMMLDFPGASGSSAGSAPARNYTGAYPPASSSGANSGRGPSPTGVHQHYAHYQPGAFAGDKGGQSGSPGYYKAGSVAPPGRGDSFNVGGAGGRSGAAPALDGSEDAKAGGAPSAPTPVIVNQSTTQDLSLPDDEFSSRHFKNGKGNRVIKQTARRGAQMGRQMLRQTGVPISF